MSDKIDIKVSESYNPAAQLWDHMCGNGSNPTYTVTASDGENRAQASSNDKDAAIAAATSRLESQRSD